MITLKNISLLSLQTAYMRRDPTTIALCAALDEQFHALGVEVKRVLIYARVDELESELLDELAWSMHVDGYNAKAGVEEKRRMIRNSLRIHRYKGTVYAIEQIISSVFGEDAEVQEWFSYGGRPYHFKINIFCKEHGASEADILRAEELVTVGKNKRSVLERIVLILFSRASLQMNCATIGSEITQISPLPQFGGGAVICGATISSELIRIEPFTCDDMEEI